MHPTLDVQDGVVSISSSGSVYPPPSLLPNERFHIADAHGWWHVVTRISLLRGPWSQRRAPLPCVVALLCAPLSDAVGYHKETHGGPAVGGRRMQPEALLLSSSFSDASSPRVKRLSPTQATAPPSLYLFGCTPIYPCCFYLFCTAAVCPVHSPAITVTRQLSMRKRPKSVACSHCV